jgi:hypothetical protein
MARQFEIMPRNPEAKGLEFQSSIYEPLPGCHNLICEVYVTAEAENIKRALNSQPDLLQACEVAQALIQSFDKAHPGGFLVGVALLSLDKAIAKAKGE